MNYVVLRWYEKLPEIDPGEDIDILIADNDLPNVVSLLEGRRSKHQPVDLYSETGLDGTTFKDIPYYTPRIAKDILDRSVRWNGLCRVPNPRDAFLSLAYHVVYHKGLASNVPIKRGAQRTSYEYKDHDYVTILADKAAIAGISLKPAEINLEYLHDFLGKVDWRPPIDTLTKLAPHNAWLKAIISEEEDKLAEHLTGLACFIVRDRGVYLLPRIRETLEKYGYDILWEAPLSNADAKVVQSHVCGGVWSRGSWPVNGGEPAHLIMAYDVFPISPHDGDMAKHPGLNNRRLLEAKEGLRSLYNHDRLPKELCNIVQSSDNGTQALQYLRLIAPQLEETLNKKVYQIHQRHQSPFPILSEFGGLSRRAKVYLIKYGDQTAVLKMFRTGRERFMEREIAAREIGKPLMNMSEILEIGENYLVLKRYRSSDRLSWMRVPGINRRGYIRPIYLKEIRKILLHFCKSGYDWIDFRPDDLILDKKEGLKALDFEFIQISSEESNNLNKCLALFPPSDDFKGELPIDFSLSVFYPYESLLRPRTGVPVELFLRDTSVWHLTLAQTVSLVRKTVPWTIARLRTWFRASRLRSRLWNIAHRIAD
ncbi:hypothetical protein M1105_12930 [Limibaculum sp. FT325]|uniref:hypothetical protein n=1 Tax=Thermohalobaculum sediminis TaxID=2939436 RepID=UPI0020BEAEAA|nr:hypothetical protein [Limibaculum sediminis]MCL5777886.1 hypothetical protein [Limibaculum sediminis]